YQALARKGKLSKETRNPCLIKVANLTGDDLPLGSVVQTGEYLLNVDFRFDDRYIWLEGNTPADPGAVGSCAILRRPIPDGDIGEAYTCGTCRAIVDVISIDHTHATPIDGSTVLASATYGPIEIV